MRGGGGGRKIEKGTRRRELFKCNGTAFCLVGMDAHCVVSGPLGFVEDKLY